MFLPTISLNALEHGNDFNLDNKTSKVGEVFMLVELVVRWLRTKFCILVGKGN